MKITELHLLLSYNYWANRKILQATQKAGRELFVAPGDLSHGGLRDTLVHILSAEYLWRRRYMDGVSERQGLNADDFADLESLLRLWGQEEQLVARFVGELTDADLEEKVSYQNLQGESLSLRLWQIFLHVVNHGTQTRSEAAVLLSQKGFSPGELDLSRFYVEQATQCC